ncbi:hypothetical protein KHQ89_05835 [Mycoplasmatota bacterium]|nr:hypothetical protein KHQ89_05835 [Mycoplasmatota bacterium]
MKNKNIYLSIISVLIITSIFGLFIVFVKSSVNFDELNQSTFESYDLNEDLLNMTDGTFRGSYEIFPMSVVVDVYIENHKIEDIYIDRQSLFFNKDAENIIPMIISMQSVNVTFNEEQESSEKILVLAIIEALEQKKLIETENIHE